MLYSLINNKPILIRSKLAASIVQDMFAREAVENEGGEEETTGGYFARKSFRFLALEFNSQNTNGRMRIRNIRTYIIGERSEPLAMVFNDQPRNIYIYMADVRPYVQNASC